MAVHWSWAFGQETATQLQTDMDFTVVASSNVTNTITTPMRARRVVGHLDSVHTNTSPYPHRPLHPQAGLLWRLT